MLAALLLGLFLPGWTAAVRAQSAGTATSAPAGSPGQEKSAWDARAKLAMDLSKIGGFSKVDVDDIVAAAERDGMAFTKDRSHIVVFDGHNFTLAKNTLFNRALFGLDSLMRKAGGVQ